MTSSFHDIILFSLWSEAHLNSQGTCTAVQLQYLYTYHNSSIADYNNWYCYTPAWAATCCEYTNSSHVTLLASYTTEEVWKHHVRGQKCWVITFAAHRLYIVNFSGDFMGETQGSLHQTGMVVTSDQNWRAWASNRLRMSQFSSFNIATIWGHDPDDAHWYAESHMEY